MSRRAVRIHTRYDGDGNWTVTIKDPLVSVSSAGLQTALDSMIGGLQSTRGTDFRIELCIDADALREMVTRSDWQTYRIVRFRRDREPHRTVIVKGLTLAQAQAHCQDPESSSKAASQPHQVGEWFDGYEAEAI